MDYQADRHYAEKLDQADVLCSYRDRFYFPQHQGKDKIYFCGNSLGLQPKAVKAALEYELEQWKTYGVDGHFEGGSPWSSYHEYLQPQSAQLVGAREEEVVVMNSLTVNLHLLLVSFYRPTAERFRIITEAAAFPSDQYALESQVRFYGFDPAQALIEVRPRAGEDTLRTEDILTAISAYKDSVALVFFGGVHYYTGQLFDLPAITEAGHAAGAKVGFDLAHAAGNVVLRLHDWEVDFAAWCSYKYLNSGPGGPGGIFVHEKHHHNSGLPRFGGWWGHNKKKRFLMKKGFDPMPGAEGWQLSNPPILSFAAHRVSLDIFAQAGMPALREKSMRLTAYLEFLLREMNAEQAGMRIITPEDPAARGCQLSIHLVTAGKQLHNFLTENGVVCDWREDNLSEGTAAGSATGSGVIRVAPVPLYNRFTEVWEFCRLVRNWKVAAEAIS